MKEKIILVTGANRGIGLEIARQLAAQGHHVIAGVRDVETAIPIIDGIKGDVRPVKLDVTDENSVLRAYDTTDALFGRLDVLINNAGVYHPSSLRDLDETVIRSTMETNFYGPMRMNAAFLPLLRRGHNPQIINMSSGMGGYRDMVTGGYAGYRLSKAGLNAQTAILAGELADEGISVNAVDPGWVRTDMGGKSAPLTVEQGADTVVWLALQDDPGTGKFWKERQLREW